MAQDRMTAKEYRKKFTDQGQYEEMKVEAGKGLEVVESEVPDSFQLRRRLFIGGKEPKKEYQVQKLLSSYLQKFYPRAEFHVDMAGTNISQAARGMNKAVQKRKGWQDFRLYEWSGPFCGLFLELKTKYMGRGEIRKLHKANGDWKSIHLQEQADCIDRMRKRKRASGFAVGIYDTLEIIDYYMAGDFSRLIPLLTKHDKGNVHRRETDTAVRGSGDVINPRRAARLRRMRSGKQKRGGGYKD